MSLTNWSEVLILAILFFLVFGHHLPSVGRRLCRLIDGFCGGWKTSRDPDDDDDSDAAMVGV